MGNKKLSKKQIKTIIAEHIEGESYNSLAKRYKVSANTIKKYCLGDPEFAQKCKEKKRACEESILSHMEKKTGEACSLMDAILVELANPDRIKESGTKELAMVFGIVFDKFDKVRNVDDTLKRTHELLDKIEGNI